MTNYNLFAVLMGVTSGLMFREGYWFIGVMSLVIALFSLKDKVFN